MIRDTNIELKRTVPIIRAVSAAIIDMHEDIGRCEEIFSHWAVRVFKKLNRQSIHLGRRRAILTINTNTNTATLPPDFHEEFFVGPIINGRKMQMHLRPDLVDPNTEEIECDDKCDKCGQDKSICNDLTITETTELVPVGDNVYTKTTVKKLYPNGNYMLEITYPVMNTQTSTIEYTTVKEFITKLDMKPCGCPDLTEQTLKKIECFCPDVFACHFTECDCTCMDRIGGYRIYDDTGLIVFDNPNGFTKVYMEYQGFLLKKNGQYHIPEVAFETIVEGTKDKYLWNKKGTPQWERRDQFDRYKMERSNMEKEINLISMGTLVKIIGMVPKFDWNEPVTDMCFVTRPTAAGTSVTDDCGSPVTQCTIPPASSAIAATSSINRVDWDLSGGETILTSVEMKGKRLLYFNIENNDSWKILLGGTPTYRQILFNSVNGTIQMPFPAEAGQFAYAIFADGLNTAAPVTPAQYTNLDDWWTTVPNQNYVEVGAVASGYNGYLIGVTDIITAVFRGGAKYNLVPGAPTGMEAMYDATTQKVIFENDFFAGETIALEFKRQV